MRLYCFKEIGSTQEFLYSQLKGNASHSKKSNPNSTTLVIALHQTNGIGSRANKWVSSNCGIYFSFAINKSHLPSDLALQSSSIYFGWLFLQRLRKYNRHVWLKWPNDIYVGDVNITFNSTASSYISKSGGKKDINAGKVGGIITQAIGQNIICGMGINIFDTFYASLYTHSDKQHLAQIIDEVLDFLGFNSVESSQILWQDTPKDSMRVSDGNIPFVDILSNVSCFTNISWIDVFNQYQQEFYKNCNILTHIIRDGIEEEISLSDYTLCRDGSLMKDGKKFYNMR